MQLSQITLGNTVQLVRVSQGTQQQLTQEGVVQYVPVSREFQVRDFNDILTTGSYYWVLPPQYLSKRLSSYGGLLSYEVYYEVDRFDVPTNDPDVIISGNGITLYHRRQNPDDKFMPSRKITVNVPLLETNWERSNEASIGGSSISTYASREDLMMVLENVTSILIRATYDNRQSLIRLGNVLLTTGVTYATGQEGGSLVEACTCPAGYAGTSCEECAPGFYRVERGQYGRECIACNCNSHSNECDPMTGICINCRDNTEGPYCNLCAEGYAGDATSGRSDACQPCPCPLTTNSFSPTCEMTRRDNIVCTACAAGYVGQNCERCDVGYRGDPTVPGGKCMPEVGPDLCDVRGRVAPTASDGTCTCKTNVKGQYCNRCKDSTFHLSADFPDGCISCFCMGVTNQCTSTSYRRDQVSLSFTSSPAGVFLTDMNQKIRITDDLSVNRRRDLVFRGFGRLQDKDGIFFWSLPGDFLGDKVSSYGGYLRFTLNHKAGRDNSPLGLNNPLVEIGGNDISLMYRPTQVVREESQTSFQVPFIESEWVKVNGDSSTREHLLMTLADLKFILIRASFAVDMEQSSIKDISMDIAERRGTGDRAYPVEECVCPQGYKGLSCEDCAPGFTRSGGGLYLGLCTQCDCNGHSDECDPETGVCRNCRDNTEGPHCERCSRGYYGDATLGSRSDCQRCPCPLTESPNQFSQECRLDSDGQVTCLSCPRGHEGRRCERCAAGFQGNPSRPGDYCKELDNTCDCDASGTMANTLCDPDSQQCRCKQHVQGLRCNTCKNGYFYLQESNPEGCLQCFCSSITSQCSSSNYYRDEIKPVFSSDGSHNFELTNRRLSKEITDGFRVNAARNEITFDRFETVSVVRGESLYFRLPPKFRGNKVSSYGGYLRFEISYESENDPSDKYMDVDVEMISSKERMYALFQRSPEMGQQNSYDILLTEQTFQSSRNRDQSRTTFMELLSDIEAILIRATYHRSMISVTLKDLRMEIAVPSPTGMRSAPEVEKCVCPEGYTGLSCQQCAPGYNRVDVTRDSMGRCVRCNCNGHSDTCDGFNGQCMNCQHNTEGDRCERCAPGFYGDPTAGTPNDCRPCPCPLTQDPNRFSDTCILDRDNQPTCTRCQRGYTGRDCGECAPGYVGNPRILGGKCERDVIDLPTVEVSPTVVSENIGATVTIQCIPRGRGPFNVVWSRLDGRPLPRGRATQGPGPSHLLTIRDLTRDDEARYVCSVSNAAGNSRDTVTLTVTGTIQPIRVRIDQASRVVLPGTRVVLVCQATQYSQGTYVLSWSKANGRLPNKAIDQNGVLVIPNVDEDDVGTYICTGSDPTGTHTARATIQIEDVNNAPRVRIEPRYLQLTEGEAAQFQCVVIEGRPAPRVYWTKGKDGPLPSYATTDESGLLRIDSVRYEDQSDYFCHATNDEGSAMVRTIIYVQQVETISVSVRSEDITTVVGDTQRLECYASGNGQVTLSWSRQGGGLPLGATQDNGILTLSGVQPSYGGVYVCTGISSSGRTDTATVSLTVLTQRNEVPTVTIDVDSETVGTGSSVSLRCIATGVPRPTVTWSRAFGDLTSNHRINGDTLIIQQATMDDRGIYICTAENVVGRRQGSVTITVERRELPVIELYPESSLVVTAGSSAMFQCRGTGMPAPTITWSRPNGRPFTGRTEVKSSSGVLMFTDVTTEEQGEYMCTAINAVGTVTATASIRVTGPPTIQITPGNRITSIVGDRVNIECVGIGDPKPNVSWKKSGRRRSDVLPEAYEDEDGNARLVFDSVSKNNEGRYVCTARNNAGRTQENVDLIVDERPFGQNASVSIDQPDIMRLTVGQSARLTCTASGLTNPQIRWSRRDKQPMPAGHSQRNGVLTIPRIDADDEGEYVCEVRSREVREPFKAFVTIIVTVTPRLTISPESLTVRTGSSLTLNCRAPGSGRYSYEWSKVGSRLSSQAVESSEGVLEIRQVTRADAGQYKCTARSVAGQTEGFANVVVIAPPQANIVEPTAAIYQGSTVELRCSAQGDPLPDIRWEKYGGELPVQHSVRNGVLTIYNIQPEDEGRYMCWATSTIGQARDYVDIRLETQIVNPTNPTTSAQILEVDIGEQIELECYVVGGIRDGVTAVWSKVEGPLPADAIIGPQILKLPSIRPEHAGTYRCIVSNEASQFIQSIQLKVKSQPVNIQRDPSYTTAALGGPAELSCDVAGGNPRPRIQWIKEGGDLPLNHELNDDGSLYIPRVRDEDAGRYDCMASNLYGTTPSTTVLEVGALIPHFAQNPQSYISYRPLNDVYLNLDVLLSFRPETTDGLLMYNGQYDTASGDFVCFGMNNQYPEFRFDVGAGPAIIKGDKPLELGKWHTVHLKRKSQQGAMMVNDEPERRGIAPGDFRGLDIGAPLYIGGVPNFRNIPRSAGFSRGFVGGVSQLKVFDVSMNLGGEAEDIVGVTQDLVCGDAFCVNGGRCRPYNNAYGRICDCPKGFVGARCELQGETCYPGACGPNNKCHNIVGGMGFHCVCPFGQTGEGCRQTIDIQDPSFNKTSFISYNKIEAITSLEFSMLFKPRSLDDGIIMYNAKDPDGRTDFIALLIKDQHLEFRFDTGSGPATLRSGQPLKVNEWTSVKVDRQGSGGTMTVNNVDTVSASANSSTIGVNLERRLYLGGVDPQEVISPKAGADRGFVGCIGEFILEGKVFSLIDNAIESMNVVDCNDRVLCERRPCLNGARCVDVSPTEYRCECPRKFTGPKCETEINVCVTDKPCQNGGECMPDANGDRYTCNCPLGYGGDNCDEAVTVAYSAEFSGKSYVQLPRGLFRHLRESVNETIELTLRTTESNGVFFWQTGKGDYLALSLENGQVKFSFDLGSGPANIKSTVRVDDGRPHNIKVVRKSRDARVIVDNVEVSGNSPGPLTVLNTRGNIFIGGVPGDVPHFTDNKYSNNFSGCISNLTLHSKKTPSAKRRIHFANKAVDGMNVKPCNN